MKFISMIPDIFSCTTQGPAINRVFRAISHWNVTTPESLVAIEMHFYRRYNQWRREGAMRKNTKSKGKKMVVNIILMHEKINIKMIRNH